MKNHKGKEYEKDYMCVCVCVYTVIYRDSILKSRDITLPKKVYLVKAMVFSVVMYGCESWTIENYVSL